jgi:hypothetical protein
LDLPFATALHGAIAALVGIPRELSGVLLIAEQFVRAVGQRQIGAETFAVLRGLMDKELEPYRTRMSEDGAAVRAAALQLAHAVRIPLGLALLENELSVREFAHPLWLGLLSREAAREVVAERYIAAIEAGKFGPDDFLDQANGLIFDLGRPFVERLAERMFLAMTINDQNAADRFIADLNLFTEYDWSAINGRSRAIVDFDTVDEDLKQFLRGGVGD